MSEIREKIICISDFMRDIKSRKQSIQMNNCFPRCNYFSYSTTLSITKWLPSIQKLDRVNKVQDQVELLLLNRNDKMTQNNYRTYFTTKYQDNKKSADNDSLDEDRFTYIKLIRKNKNTTIKTEKLVLDVAILLSRIGGLCSLFIGLTVAFFIELIEFVYLLVHMSEPRTLPVDANTKDPISPNDVVHWEIPKPAKEYQSKIKRTNHFSLEIDEKISEKFFSLSNKTARIQESDDNDISIWHQGEPNNTLWERKAENVNFPKTIVSEL